MLEDAGVPLLVTQTPIARRLASTPESKDGDGEALRAEVRVSNIDVICLDRECPRIATSEYENLVDQATADSPAYVVYTSGSTGRPRGVLGTHRGTVNRIDWMARVYPFGDAEICCQKTSLSFVDAVAEIFGPLLAGVRLVVIPEPVVKDPPRLICSLASHGVSRIVLVPSLLSAILDTDDDLAEKLPALKLWVSSGEILLRSLAARFLERLPGRILLNLYGSSEVAGDVAHHAVRGVTPEGCNIPIGRPIANTKIFILDRYRNLVPVGVVGEVNVAGMGLARGYLNHPLLTSESFIRNPFDHASPSSLDELEYNRLYRTGDLGRYLPDGNIEFMGRTDQQLKIRGYRVEPGEIEALLREHPAVRQSAVVARDARAEDRRLDAYVLCVRDQKAEQGDLRRFLERRLPGYMVPSSFSILDEFPVTPSGKIDRLRLPDPAPVGPRPDGRFVAPREGLETQLARMWEEVLQIRPVGATDGFFDLGGHSLLAVQLIATIEEELERELPIAALFEKPTVSGLAEFLYAGDVDMGESMLATVRPIEHRKLSGSQSAARQLVIVGASAYAKVLDGLEIYTEIFCVEFPFLAGAGISHWRKAGCPDIEQIAAESVRQLLPLLGTRPTVVTGFSFHGVLAREIARGLVDEGGRVDHVVLVDVPTYELWWLPVRLAFIGMVVANKLLRASRTPRRLLRSHPYRSAGTTLAQLFEIYEIGPPRNSVGKILEGYTPSRYHGDLTNIRTTRKRWIALSARKQTYDWGRFVTGTSSVNHIDNSGHLAILGVAATKIA